MPQIYITLFYIAWLLALLALLFLIWRSSEKRLKHIQSMELTLFDIAKRDSESARQAVESLKALVALMQKGTDATDR